MSTTSNKTVTKIQTPKIDQEFADFLEFRAWKDRQASAAAGVESDSDATPPRTTQQQSKGHTKVVDPQTDPSSDEDESKPVVLVYRRAKDGTKYRTYEPYNPAGEVQTVYHTWVRDPTTGREYKRAVPVDRSSVSHPQSVLVNSCSSRDSARLVDHRHMSATPETGHRVGIRTPSTSTNRSGHPERVPGIVSLEEREGKQSDKKTPTIVDWAKNCPMTYAEKVKYEEMNLPIWIWAYISEILASRTGLSPDMPTGELEARLQHLLCVLQVTLVHSEKSDFMSTGWSIASIYAKRVQQKLDRGLETWTEFRRFGHDPHPSEMFTAKTEADKKAQPKKKGLDSSVSTVGKKLCTTWNNCETERKCQYMVDNPTAKCVRRHECSYCSEKGYGVTQHQRRFCKRRRDAGEA